MNNSNVVLTRFDSFLELVYSVNQIDFFFVPAGTIRLGRTQFMSAIGGAFLPQHTSEMESKMKMVGTLNILHFFMHHVENREKHRKFLPQDV
ncbi:hypothetical protein MKW94_022260 [Papaver nudicaule]|uniref:Uncharacterized protein n=1 Tax=Papaver nudicaule TaxID=74823 RepID=A0AA41SBH6_PAPNU|nr:hypothetical protein [Papaver nudicaule]